MPLKLKMSSGDPEFLRAREWEIAATPPGSSVLWGAGFWFSATLFSFHADVSLINFTDVVTGLLQ